MSDLPQPYDENIPPLEGRIVLQAPNIRVVKDNPYLLAEGLTEAELIIRNEELRKPYPNEMFLDDDLLQWVCFYKTDPVTGAVSFEYLSPLKEMEKRFDFIEQQGYLNQIASAWNNGRIYNFYIDNVVHTVHPNPDLVFPKEFKYYSIRKQELNDADGFVYVSGIYDPVLETLTFLNEMSEITDNITGTTYTKMKPSRLFQTSDPAKGFDTVTNGFFYVVDFYNADKVIVQRTLFQAVNASFLNSNTLSPTSYVTDLKVSVLRNSFPQTPGQNDTFSLNINDTIDMIDFSISAVFSNGTERIVTEYLGTARLQISGFDEINTSVAGNVFPVTFTYFQNQDPDTGEILGSSISKKINFIIIDSSMPIIEKVTPVIWKDSASIDNAKSIFRMKVFGTEYSEVTPEGEIVDADRRFINKTKTMYNSMRVVNDMGGTEAGILKTYDPYNESIIFEINGSGQVVAYGFDLYSDKSLEDIRFVTNMTNSGDVFLNNSSYYKTVAQTEELEYSLYNIVHRDSVDKFVFTIGSTTETFPIEFNKYTTATFRERYGETIGSATIYLVKDKLNTPLVTVTNIDTNTDELVFNIPTTSENTALIDAILPGDQLLVLFKTGENGSLITYDTFKFQ